MATEVAEALDYLHNRDSQPVIHRDVKSSNILLSEEFEPQVCFVQASYMRIFPMKFLTRDLAIQLADFGLATWSSSASSFLVSSDVAGTFGWVVFFFQNVTLLSILNQFKSK